jgi:hypothetical protein
MLELIVVILLIKPIYLWYCNRVPDTSFSLDALPGYLTLLAILIAVLSIWAQLTVRTSRANDDTKSRTVTIAVFWDYVAITVSIMALAIFLLVAFNAPLYSFPCLRFVASRVAIALSVTAFTMAFAHAVGLVITTVCKGICGKTLFQSVLPDLKREFYKLAFLLEIGVFCLFFRFWVLVFLLLPFIKVP